MYVSPNQTSLCKLGGGSGKHLQTFPYVVSVLKYCNRNSNTCNLGVAHHPPNEVHKFQVLFQPQVAWEWSQFQCKLTNVYQYTSQPDWKWSKEGLLACRLVTKPFPFKLPCNRLIRFTTCLHQTPRMLPNRSWIYEVMNLWDCEFMNTTGHE